MTSQNTLQTSCGTNVDAKNGRRKMSYDISLCDPVTHETLEVDDMHFIDGGTRSYWRNKGTLA